MHSRSRRAVTGVLATAALVAGLAVPSSALAADPARLPHAEPARAAEVAPSDELIVRFRPGTRAAARARIARDRGMSVVRSIPGTDIAVLRVEAGSRAAARTALADTREVLTTQPNYRRSLAADPRDEELFEYLWGMNNTGQIIGGVTGKANVDIDLPQAHAVTTGDEDIVVAVIDSGVDFSQPDLMTRAWINEGEVGPDGMGGDKKTNGVDDDGNGYTDDWRGWDFCNGDNTVFDTNVADNGVRGHGTHVAGTIAASLDGEGVVGVASSVKIMALKFIDGRAGCGTDEQAIAAIEYAKRMGARIINASWGGEGNGSLLQQTIAGSGALFVAAAGNGNPFGVGYDLGQHPFFPAAWPNDNILSVAAIDPRGRLTAFSNYGSPEVDLAAPGYWVASTYPQTLFDDGWCLTPCYAFSNGTSMAAPHVSGVAALAATVRPELLDDPEALKARLLAATKPLSATAGKTVTGGMVDALYAVDTVAPTSAGPSSQAFITGERIGNSALTRLRWGAGSDDLSGVGSYVVHRSLNGGGSWSTLASKATTTSLDTKVALGSTVRYRVRARDRGGNVGSLVEGPTIRAQISQQGTSAAKYGSGWKKAKSSSASGGSTSYATKTGASVTYTFTGRAIAIVAPKASNRGSFKVYINGTLAGTVSTYAKKTKTRVVVFARSWTTSQKRTIKLVVSGTKGHPRVDVDAFLVLR